jgi:branched-chain amino acid transport system permease protein
MLRAVLAPRKLLAFALLAFFLFYWIPFSNVFPGWVPLQFGSYRVFQATTIAMWAILVLGLNLLTGYNGQISLGHGAFVAVGAYTAAILMFDHNWPFWATIPVGGLITGVIGFGVGVPALRLTGPYLAIATLALAMSTPQILQKYEGLTHGSQGINVQSPPPPAILDGVLNSTQWIYFLALVIAIVMTVIAWNIVHSRVGRAFVAIRDSEIASQAMGISVPRFKTMAFAISAFYAGVCGALYIQVIGFVSPQSFGVMQSINYLTTIVVGGLASILGSILGAAAFVLVPEINTLLRDVFHLPVAAQAPGLIYGASLILVMIFMPYGFAGFVRRLTRLQPPLVRQSLADFSRRIGLRLGTARAASTGGSGAGATPPKDVPTSHPPDEGKGSGSS